jgi:hypothetical protein
MVLRIAQNLSDALAESKGARTRDRGPCPADAPTADRRGRAGHGRQRDAASSPGPAADQPLKMAARSTSSVAVSSFMLLSM